MLSKDNAGYKDVNAEMEPSFPRNFLPSTSAKTSTIRLEMIQLSRRFQNPNFTVIGANDLSRLFHLYDAHFFAGWLANTVLDTTNTPLTFRLSSTMTRSGGMTIRTSHPQPSGKTKVRYEIAIASRMLFMSFADIDRPVVVCGLPCADRLHALQRIMEHEIIHLFELLKWGKSSCKGKRFAGLARQYFGHTKMTHDLVTPLERAAIKHAIRPGDRVQFEFEGTRLLGRVNRIHHRATVLVETADGIRYSDGKRYKKYYVPLPNIQTLLQAASQTFGSKLESLGRMAAKMR
jgi:hypothetical protein